MVDQTPNHELNQYRPGDTDWTHAPDMATIEERLVIRDVVDALDRYDPHDGATFIATDTGAVFDGEDGEWVPATRGYETVGIGADGRFRFTVEDGDLVLEGIEGDLILRNPKTIVDGEKRAILYEGGTFGETTIGNAGARGTDVDDSTASDGEEQM